MNSNHNNKLLSTSRTKKLEQELTSSDDVFVHFNSTTATTTTSSTICILTDRLTHNTHHIFFQSVRIPVSLHPSLRSESTIDSHLPKPSRLVNPTKQHPIIKPIQSTYLSHQNYHLNPSIILIILITTATATTTIIIIQTQSEPTHSPSSPTTN
jgi:hypothetical protein